MHRCRAAGGIVPWSTSRLRSPTIGLGSAVECHYSFRPATRTAAILLLAIVVPFLESCTNPPAPPEGRTTAAGPVIPGRSAPLRRVRLLPYWIPSAQFAGYYVGIDRRIFEKHGLQLDMLPFRPSVPVEDVFAKQQAEFALLWLANAIELRAKGVDVVNIAQLSSRSSLMLITKKSSGISTLQGMNGKRAGIWMGFEKQPQALFKKYNLNVHLIPIGSTNNLFLQDGVDILNANWFDEYHSVLNNGLNEDELNTFYLADYGLNFLEDGIYSLANTVNADPDLCAKFVAAVVESWQYAFDHQEEAIDIVVRYARAQNQAVNRSHQRWMLSCYRTLYLPAGTTTIHTGLRRDDYEAVQQVMIQNRFVSRETPYDTFHRPVDRRTEAR